MSRSILRTLLLVPALALLAACATSGGGATQASQKRLQPAQYEIDAERVAYIESVARKRGVEVRWVNKPMRPASPGGF